MITGNTSSKLLIKCDQHHSKQLRNFIYSFHTKDESLKPTNNGHRTMSNKFILAVFIILMSGLIALGLQSNPAQIKCEELNQNKPELLKLCPTLGN